MRTTISLLVALLLLAGCGQVDQAAAPRPLPAPASEPRTEELDEDQVRIWPRSAPIEHGVPYSLTAFTHCGLDHTLDVDGSFWEVVDAPDDPWAVLDNPDDDGVITILDDDHAIYTSSGGGRFGLVRTEGPRDVLYCD